MTFNILIPWVPPPNGSDSDMYQWFNNLNYNIVPDGLGFEGYTIINIVSLYWSHISDAVFALCTITDTV